MSSCCCCGCDAERITTKTYKVGKFILGEKYKINRTNVVLCGYSCLLYLHKHDNGVVYKFMLECTSNDFNGFKYNIEQEYGTYLYKYPSNDFELYIMCCDGREIQLRKKVNNNIELLLVDNNLI